MIGLWIFTFLFATAVGLCFRAVRLWVPLILKYVVLPMAILLIVLALFS